MSADKLKLLYIASNGRSGSTVLDLLLGTHPSGWTLGEFNVLPWELRTPTKTCGCGTPVEQCSFWASIVAEARDVLLNGSIDLFRDTYSTGRVIRRDQLSFLFSNSPRYPARNHRELKQFGEDNLQVMRLVLEKARRLKGDQVTWLIDSSKCPYRLLWLKETGMFDIRVIHLVKDPRAFVFSICRHNSARPRIPRVVRATVRWNVENYFFERLFGAHFQPQDVLRTRYDFLAGQPEAALEQMTQWLGIPHDETLPSKLRSENHAICGNPSRFSTDGIRLDQKWRAELSRLAQGSVRAASFLLAGKYGFPW